MTSRMALHSASRRSGFTLIELVIAIVLIGLLAAVGTSMIADSFETTYMMNASEANSARGRNALERIEREIREVGYDTATAAFRTTAGEMAAGSFAFFQNDGTTKVTIAISGSTLTLAYTLGGTTTTSTLADNVSGFGFTYRQANGTTAATTPAQLGIVDIAFTVTDARSGQVLPQRSRVALRNRG